MSDDEADEELLALLRKSLGIDLDTTPQPPKIGVLEDAEYIYDNSTDVALDMRGTKLAAASIGKLIQEKGYGTTSWSKHELHPKARDASTVNFIFLMDLLNFSFWPDDPTEPFTVSYSGKSWTGYWSLVAAIHRALDEGIPITTPTYWTDQTSCPDSTIHHIFRSATTTPIPLLDERITCMREAGSILHSHFSGTPTTLIQRASSSAAGLVNLLTAHFPTFNDTHLFHSRPVRFHKRAQILVADLWACFEGKSYGRFTDIDQITMFADYRIPQILTSLNCLRLSPPLASQIQSLKPIASGHPFEVQLRGCSIWCVELIRREMARTGGCGGEGGGVNAVLIDFFLYDLVKEMEARESGVEREGEGAGKERMGEGGLLPHHRTRSIWY